MMTGLRPATFENLQLNAGVFLTGFSHSGITDSASLATAVLTALEAGTGVLGATSGGGSFECTPATRQIEADGKRMEFVGSTIYDSWTIKLKTTLIEATADNFARAIPTASAAVSGNVTTVTARPDLRDGDYISTLCWIGDTSKGFVMIELSNALNIVGAAFTFTDKGEGKLPVEFQAHCNSIDDMDELPFKIVYFNPAPAQSP